MEWRWKNLRGQINRLFSFEYLIYPWPKDYSSDEEDNPDFRKRYNKRMAIDMIKVYYKSFVRKNKGHILILKLTGFSPAVSVFS